MWPRARRGARTDGYQVGQVRREVGEPDAVAGLQDDVRAAPRRRGGRRVSSGGGSEAA